MKDNDFSNASAETISLQYVYKASPSSGYNGDTGGLVWNIVTAVIIAWGTVGNILTILVLLRQLKKMSSTSIYILTLAVSDLTQLWCDPFKNWMKQMWNINVQLLGDIGCRFLVYLTHASVHFSAWILVAVTIERALSTLAPGRVKVLCSRRNSLITVICLFVAIFGIDLVIPVIFGLGGFQSLKNQGQVNCVPTTVAYMEFWNDIWHWIDFCLTFALPFTFLMAGNIMITRKILNTIAHQKKLGEKSGSGTRSVTPSSTVLVVFLGAIFCVTMTPISVFQIYYPYRLEEIVVLFTKDREAAKAAYRLLLLQYSVVNILSYVNATCNFVLYVFTSARFRKELKCMLCCSKDRRDELFTSLVYRSPLKHLALKHKVNNSTVSSKTAEDNSPEKTVVTKSHRHEESGTVNQMFTDDSVIISISSILSRYKITPDKLHGGHTDDSDVKSDVLQDSSNLTVSSEPRFMDVSEILLYRHVLKISEDGQMKELNGFALEL